MEPRTLQDTSARDILVLEVLPQVAACRQMMEQQVPFDQRIVAETALEESLRQVWDRLEPSNEVPSYFQGLRLQWGVREAPIIRMAFDSHHGITRDRTGPHPPLSEEMKQELEWRELGSRREYYVTHLLTYWKAHFNTSTPCSTSQ